MTLREREDIGKWKRRHQIARGKLIFEKARDSPYVRIMNEWKIQVHWFIVSRCTSSITQEKTQSAMWWWSNACGSTWRLPLTFHPPLITFTFTFTASCHLWFQLPFHLDTPVHKTAHLVRLHILAHRRAWICKSSGCHNVPTGKVTDVLE